MKLGQQDRFGGGRINTLSVAINTYKWPSKHNRFIIIYYFRATCFDCLESSSGTLSVALLGIRPISLTSVQVSIDKIMSYPVIPLRYRSSNRGMVKISSAVKWEMSGFVSFLGTGYLCFTNIFDRYRNPFVLPASRAM